jgi:hypothetical protein
LVLQHSASSVSLKTRHNSVPCRAVANGGVWGVWHPPENKLSANEGICRQTKNNIPQNVKLNRNIQHNSPQRHKKVFSGGIPPPPPPPALDTIRAAKSHGLPVSLQVFALTSRSHAWSWKSHGFH